MNLLETTSALLVRHLPRDRLLALRAAYHAGRAKLAPVMRAVHGTFDAAALRTHLDERLGNFEILMVHSAINNMLPYYTGSPLEFVRMLMDFCGPHRTLAMPAFCFNGDPAGIGPRFDVRRMPSQMGLATELFRRSKGVRVSRHPIVRVAALGPLAEALTTGHETASLPCGVNSPFDFMARQDTLIIGVGKPFEVLTHVHHAEDVMGAEFPVPRSPERHVGITLVDGDIEIPISLNASAITWKRDMWRLRGIMNPQTLREWTFHRVPMFATRAADVTAALVDAARRGVTIYVPPKG